jgi:succinate-acetate transporter protein
VQPARHPISDPDSFRTYNPKPAWFCITTVFLVASIRSSVGIFSLILALDITFILLAASEWTGNKHLQTAGGAFGILTAAIGFYIGTASLLTPNLSYFVLPLGSLAKDDDADTALPPSNQNGGNTEANTNANANAGGAEYRRPNLKEQFGLAPDPNPTHVVKPTKNTPKLHRTITPGGHPMDNSQPGFPIFHRKTANPVPLGAVGIGSTFMLLGLALVHSRGIDEIAVWYAIGLPLGGLGVLLAGMWSFPEGNTFAATVFGGLGGLILGFCES